jgi:hypothetical protein
MQPKHSWQAGRHPMLSTGIIECSHWLRSFRTDATAYKWLVTVNIIRTWVEPVVDDRRMLMAGAWSRGSRAKGRFSQWSTVCHVLAVLLRIEACRQDRN